MDQNSPWCTGCCYDLYWRFESVVFLLVGSYKAPSYNDTREHLVCACCGKGRFELNKTLLRCAGCAGHPYLQVYYCSKECQRAHWNTHKIPCKISKHHTASLARLDKDNTMMKTLKAFERWKAVYEDVLTWAANQAYGWNPRAFQQNTLFNIEPRVEKGTFPTILPGEKGETEGAPLVFHPEHLTFWPAVKFPGYDDTFNAEAPGYIAYFTIEGIPQFFFCPRMRPPPPNEKNHRLLHTLYPEWPWMFQTMCRYAETSGRSTLGRLLTTIHVVDGLRKNNPRALEKFNVGTISKFREFRTTGDLQAQWDELFDAEFTRKVIEQVGVENLKREVLIWDDINNPKEMEELSKAPCIPVKFP